MLNFFNGVTNKPSNWQNNALVNWTCPSDASTTPCCTLSNAMNFDCDFTSILLRGTVNSNGFADQNFNLQHLRIKSDGTLATTSGVNWGGFPTALQTLNLDNVNFAFPGIDTSQLSRGLVTLQLFNIRNTGPFSFTGLPPNLLTLRLRENPTLAATLTTPQLPRFLINCELNDLNLQGTLIYNTLPRTLETLIIASPNPAFGASHNFINLPRGLQTFRLEETPSISGGWSWADLPRTMRECSLINTGYAAASTIDLQWNNLPQNLTALTVTGHQGIKARADFSTLASVAPQLRYLRLNNNQFFGDVDATNFPASLEIFRVYSNNFNGRLLLPPTRPSNSVLTEFNAHSNSLTGTVDGSKFPLSVETLNLNNNKLNSIINFNDFGDALRILSVYQNPNMNGTLNWDGVSLRGLEQLQIHVCQNLQSQNLGMLSMAPRGLRTILAGQNSINSTLDFIDSPTTLTNVNFGGNLLVGQVLGLEKPIPSQVFNTLILWGNRGLNGVLNISSLGNNSLQVLSLNNCKFSSLGDESGQLFASLPSTMTSFQARNNNIQLRGQFVNFSSLPANLNSFQFLGNSVQQATGIIASAEDLPSAFQSPVQQVLLCEELARGNSWKEFKFCNITRSMSISRSRRSASISSSLAETSTKTLSRTYPTASQSSTRSRSIIDFARDWMLNVVLKDVENLPVEWATTKLKDWRCPPFNDYLCCPYDASRELYSCNFKAGTFVNGSVEIYFPKEYPLRSFTFVDMPRIKGHIRIHELPDSLLDLEVERTSIEASTLWFYRLPPLITSLKLSDNNFNIADISFGGGTPNSLKVIQLAGGKIGGTRNFRGVPENMTLLDLSRQRFIGPVPWNRIPRGMLNLNLAGNRFSGSVSLHQLPTSIVSLNVSNNRFDDMTPNLLNGTLPPHLEVLDFSSNFYNNRLKPPPVFSNLSSTAIREIYASDCNFSGQLLTMGNLLNASSLERIVLKNNDLLGDFEVYDGLLPPLLLSNKNRFCADILTGNHFTESKTCDLTHSISLSETLSLVDNSSTSSVSEPSPSRGSITQSDRTESDSAPYHASGSVSFSSSLSDNKDDSPTVPKTLSLSPSALSSTFTVPGSITADTLTETESITIYTPPDPVVRHQALKTTLEIAASVAVIATPSVASAAMTVSRQTAIARTFGGLNDTCGGPTRLDPLSFFEDPFGFDLNPRQCWGQLAGIFTGNMILCFAIPLVFWLMFATYDAIVTRKLPNFWDGMKTGWPLEVITIVVYGMLLPPAVSSMLVAAVRCSYGIAGMFSALSYVLFAAFLIFMLFVREKLERFFFKRYRFSRRKKTDYRPVKQAINWLFSPSGVWRFQIDEEEIKRRDRAEAEAKALPFASADADSDLDVPLMSRAEEKGDDVEKQPQHQNNNVKKEVIHETEEEREKKRIEALIDEIENGGNNNNNNNDDDDDESNTQEKRGKRNTEERSSSSHSSSSTAPTTEQKEETPEQKLMREEEEERKFKKRIAHSELRFNVLSRVLDKYNARNWYFICAEIGARAVMTIGPAVAEAVPSSISCTILRIIYLLSINMLLIAIIGRRPYVHRALFIASVVATFVEDVVLVLLLISGRDVAEEVVPWMLTVVQIIATVLTIGIEVVEFGFAPRHKWLRGKTIGYDGGRRKKVYASIEEELEDHEKKDGGADDDDEDDEDSDQELITSLDQLKGLSAQERSALMQSGIGISLEQLDAMESQRSNQRRRRVLADGSNRGNGGAGGNADDGHEADGGADAEELDLFSRLDRRLRRAYSELAAEEVFIVPKNLKYQEAKIQFEELVNL